MGCKNTTPAVPEGTLLEQYSKANLPQPWSGQYENDFEKQIYMAINLCRHDPKSFVPYVRQVYKEHVLLKAGAGKKMNDLIAKLQATESLKLVSFDEEANQAVRANNADKIASNEDKPTKGGNIAKYSEIKGNDSSATCTEFTMPQFEGTTGTEFIALQLALDFEDFEAAVEAAKKPKGSELTAETTSGEQTAAAAPALPADENAANPEGQAAKDATKDASKAAKPAGAPTKPSYTPILDEEVQMVGICNKAHKKTRNLIQVLYIKSQANAMV